MLKGSKFRLSCWLVVFAFLNSTLLIEANKHSHGLFKPKDTDDIILNRHIFVRNTSQPTNYTILYKYLRNKSAGTINYIEIDVQNCTSTGYIHFNTNYNDTKCQESVIQAVLQLYNCTHFNVTAQIRGYGASRASLLTLDPLAAELFDDKLFEPKSFTFIYAHNETRSKNRLLTIGQRQINDTLVKFEKITVTNELSRYPEQEISYNSPNAFITQVEFKFDSPTAMAFLNSSFIQQHSFNAIIYDLNRPEFTANVSIYGYFDAKPLHYKSIITP